MTREQIATADIDTINCRQDALKGDDSTEAGIERGLIGQRREELANEFYDRERAIGTRDANGFIYQGKGYMGQEMWSHPDQQPKGYRDRHQHRAQNTPARPGR